MIFNANNIGKIANPHLLSSISRSWLSSVIFAEGSPAEEGFYALKPKADWLCGSNPVAEIECAEGDGQVFVIFKDDTADHNLDEFDADDVNSLIGQIDTDYPGHDLDICVKDYAEELDIVNTTDDNVFGEDSNDGYTVIEDGETRSGEVEFYRDGDSYGCFFSVDGSSGITVVGDSPEDAARQLAGYLIDGFYKPVD